MPLQEHFHLLQIPLQHIQWLKAKFTHSLFSSHTCGHILIHSDGLHLQHSYSYLCLYLSKNQNRFNKKFFIVLDFKCIINTLNNKFITANICLYRQFINFLSISTSNRMLITVFSCFIGLNSFIKIPVSYCI